MLFKRKIIPNKFCLIPVIPKRGLVAQKKTNTHLSVFYLKFYTVRLALGMPRDFILSFKIPTPIYTSACEFSVFFDQIVRPIVVLQR